MISCISLRVPGFFQVTPCYPILDSSVLLQKVTTVTVVSRQTDRPTLSFCTVREYRVQSEPIHKCGHCRQNYTSLILLRKLSSFISLKIVAFSAFLYYTELLDQLQGKLV